MSVLFGNKGWNLGFVIGIELRKMLVTCVSENDIVYDV